VSAIDAFFQTFYETANLSIGSVALFVDAMPVSYALGAGMLASVNPCGFIMLPAFAAFYFTAGSDEDDTDAGRRLMRALQMGGLVTLAFILTFGIVGTVVGIGGHALLQYSGWAGLAIGGALIALGLYQLIARRSLFAGAVNLRVSPQATVRGVLAFGVAYAAASLSCTLPIFLTVVSGVFAGSGGIALAAADFIQYAVGMGLVLTLITVSIAFSRNQTTQLVSGVLPYVNTVGNVLLVFAGAYLVWYWTGLGQIV